MFNEFMRRHFPGVQLRKPIFYQWKIGIRFELGDPELDLSQKKRYVREAGDRAIALYQCLHQLNDELLIVTNAHFANRLRHERRLNVYRHRVTDQRVLKRLQHWTIPYVYAEEAEDEGIQTERFVLACRGQDVQYAKLIRAICHADLCLKPAIEHEVYIVNQTTQTIFHVYDDRGCDVIATSAQALRDVYETYHAWILDYDRERIIAQFAAETSKQIGG